MNLRPARIETDVPGITAIVNHIEKAHPFTHERVQSWVKEEEEAHEA